MSKYSLRAFTIAMLILLAVLVINSANAATIEITNNIQSIQLSATMFDNGGNLGRPTIKIWAPGSGGSGRIVQPGASFTYLNTVADGSSVKFDIQLNSARLTFVGGQCNLLCGHVNVTISSDGSTCSISQGHGSSCGASGSSPSWSAPAQSNIAIKDGVCNIRLTRAIIPSSTVCTCQNGKHPCQTKLK